MKELPTPLLPFNTFLLMKSAHIRSPEVHTCIRRTISMFVKKKKKKEKNPPLPIRDSEIPTFYSNILLDVLQSVEITGWYQHLYD